MGKPVVKFVERKMSKVQATYSTGYAASATLFGLGEISGQFGVTMDTSGNVALQYSYAGGITTGGLGASVTRYSSITNAPGYEALNGPGYQVGGAFAFPVSGVPVAVGGDFNIIENTNDPGKSYYGITGNVGFGTPGGEMHVLWGETQTIEGTQFNIFEVASDIYTRIMEW